MLTSTTNLTLISQCIANQFLQLDEETLFDPNASFPPLSIQCTWPIMFVLFLQITSLVIICWAFPIVRPIVYITTLSTIAIAVGIGSVMDALVKPQDIQNSAKWLLLTYFGLRYEQNFEVHLTEQTMTDNQGLLARLCIVAERILTRIIVEAEAAKTRTQ